jgi:predicted RNA-binding Zn ribbon-like protein
VDHTTAPGDLELVQCFANTVNVEDSNDGFVKPGDLDDPEGFKGWLLDHGFVSARDRVSPGDLRNALALRDALRALALANHDRNEAPEALRALQGTADRAGLTPRFAPGEPPVLEPTAKGADRALGRIVAIVFAAMSDGSWDRLKICRSDTCRWVFWDYSKNQSRAWCSMKVCGNREKVKSYRRRAKRGARPSS